MSNTFQDVRAIFLAALEKPAEQWDDYLAEACGEDASLRDQVNLLLQTHAEGSGILDRGVPPAAPTLDQPITEKPGTVIGPYKLLQQLGEGGMGVVYMAEQKEPVKRRVALKIIKPGMDTRQVIARFEAERQALAMMDHPNIAKVLDAGATESGRPYFVMELVNGLPVTKYCDQQHLTPKERLELFGPICQAVQHAHQKGIIHRDLKPSNILVALYDGQPVPKVIDFGVAKATSQTLTEKTMFTQLGQVVGTLEYMSPEQAERNQLDIDTRSDIYSLGVVLYELLTGDTPFDRTRLRSAAFDEMLRIIREEEPPRPSTKLSSSAALPSIAANRHIEPQRLSRLVRGELDWIVMKALEKDRARRYETATGFANDIERYLNDEAVVACPPSRAYRFRKFARRNRSQLATASVLALALLVAVGGVGWAVRDRAAQRAEMARERASRQQQITTRVELLLADVDQLAGAQRWEDALATAVRAKAVLAGSNVMGAMSERGEVTLQELEFVARLAEIRIESSAWLEKGGERTAWLEKGVEVPAWFDRTTWNFDNSAAARSYRTAFREFGVDVEALPAAEALARLRQHPRIALPLAIALDQFVYNLSFSGVDETTWRPLLDVAQGLDPDPLRNQLRAVWRQEVTPELQSAMRKLVDAFEVQKHGAETANRLAIALRRAELPELQEQILRQAQQVFPGDYWLNLNLGKALLDQPPYTEAARFTTAALAIKPNGAAALTNLGCALGRQDKLDEAIACYRKAIELDPKLPPPHLNLGNALADQGKPDEAIACFRQALEVNPKWAFAHNNIGTVFYDQGKLDEAIACFRQALELDPKLAPAHRHLGIALCKQKKLNEAIACFRKALELDPKCAHAHYNLGVALSGQGELDEAIACYRQALEVDPNDALAHNNLGSVFANQGKLDEAIACFRQALELDPNFAQAHHNLGTALQQQGKPDEAIACYRQALELDPNDALTHNNLGSVFANQGKLDEAIACFRQALELDPKWASAHSNLGNALQDQHKLDEAIECYRQALELDPNFAQAHNNLGFVFANQGKLDEAIACYRKAIELDPKHVFAYNNLGNALKKQGNLDEAFACFRRALELNPNDASAHVNLGIALYWQKKLDEAIASYRKALELDPNYAQAHHNLGNILQDQRKLDEAIECYRKAIELDPKHVFAHGNLGNALGKQQKLDEAIACFRKAIELDPKRASSHRNLGIALGKQQKLDEAIACFRKAIELDPKHVFAHGNLGNALMKQDKLDEAIVCYRKAIELSPKDAVVRNSIANACTSGSWRLATTPDLSKRDPAKAVELAKLAIEIRPKRAANDWNNLGVAQYRVGNWQAAVEALEKADAMIEGADRAHRMFFAMAHWQLGDEEKARELYGQGAASRPNEHFRAEAEELMGITEEDRKRMVEEYFVRQVEDRPRDAQVWSDRANWYQQQGAYDKAIEDYSQAIKLNPDDSRLWQKRTLAYNVAGQFDLAVQDANKAIELDPTCTIPFVDRAWAHYGRGEFQKGIADCAQAIHLDPNCYCGYERRAWGHRLIGDFEAAVADAERAIEINPDMFDAYRQLATAHAALQQWDKALSAASEAIRLNPGALEAYRVRADAYLKMQQYDKAIVDLSEAIRLNPNPWRYRVRGDAYRSLGRWDDAVDDYRRAVEIAPDRAGDWIRLIDVGIARGATDGQMQSLVNEAEVTAGGSGYLMTATWSLLSNRRSEYEKICHEAAARYAESVDPGELRRVAHAGALISDPVLDTKQLVSMIRRAVEAKPVPSYQHTMGLCLLRDQQIDVAIQWFNRSLEKEWEGAPSNWLGLAIAHGAAGRKGEATDWLRKAQEWFKQHPLDRTSEVTPVSRVTCQLLLQEADQLIEPTSSVKDNDTSKTQ